MALKTEEQVKQNLNDARVLFFQSCFERGVLDEVLKESAFQAHVIVKRKDEKTSAIVILWIYSFLFSPTLDDSQCRA